jgi:sugar diacid utilization regulator
MFSRYCSATEIGANWNFSRAHLILSAVTTSTRRCSTRLKPFLSYNGQVETAAAKLNVHRHTMRNRLRRIR